MRTSYTLAYALILSILLSTTGFSTPKMKSASHWSAGLGGIISPNLYQKTKTKKIFFPVLSYDGKRFYFYGPFLGYRFITKPNFTLAANAFLYSVNFDPSDSTSIAMKQLNSRHYSVMLGLNAKWSFKQYGNLNGEISRAMIGATNGYFASISYAKGFMLSVNQYSRLLLTPKLGVQYDSKRLVNYYYGISPLESTKSGLDFYQGSKGVISPFVSFTASYFLGKHWSARFSTRVIKLGKFIKDSPMVGRSVTFTSMLMLSYRF